MKTKYIPYQKCPVCEGNKKVWINQFDPWNTNSGTIGWQTCGICGGAGIIPMYRENKRAGIISSYDSILYYGINGTGIPKELIPGAPKVKNGDMIESTIGQQLVYNANWKGFFIVTDDHSKFLTKEDLKREWRKI
jgi:hypothetical protein